jgi:hypothetical protein
MSDFSQPHHLGPPPRRVQPGMPGSMGMGGGPMGGMQQPGMMMGPGAPAPGTNIVQQPLSVGMGPPGQLQITAGGFPQQNAPRNVVTVPVGQGPPQPMSGGLGGGFQQVTSGGPPPGYGGGQQQQQMHMMQQPASGNSNWAAQGQPQQQTAPAPQMLGGGVSGYSGQQQQQQPMYSSLQMPNPNLASTPQRQPMQQPWAANRKTGPASPNLLASNFNKPMVRFDESPPEQIQTRASFKGLPSHNPSLYASTDRMYSDKQLNSSLYASADGVLENRSSLMPSMHPYGNAGVGSNNNGMANTGLNNPGQRPNFSVNNLTSNNTTSKPATNNPTSDRTVMRSEADKIAERLLKTEEELDRLRKQGQLIGESLRRQKILEEQSPSRQRLTEFSDPPRTTLTSPAQPSQTSTFQLSKFGGTMAAPTTPKEGKSVSFKETASEIPPVSASPRLSLPPQAGLGLGSASLPNAAATNRGAPPGAPPPEQLQQTTLSTQECTMLGLPPGTMWFDPSNPAQMQIINDQLSAGKQPQGQQPPHPSYAPQSTPQSFSSGQQPAAPGQVAPATGSNSVTQHVPRTSGTSVLVPSIKMLRDDEIARHFEVLNLVRDTASVSDVVRAYKRFAPRLVESPEDLASYTVSFKVCEAAAGQTDTALRQGSVGQGDAQGTRFDPLAVYHAIVYTGKKHAELKVIFVIHFCVFQCLNRI